MLAYVYTDFLQFVGPVQSALRQAFGWGLGDYWFPDVRSLGGAVVMFVFVLYPYVYLLARTAFIERSTTGHNTGFCPRPTDLIAAARNSPAAIIGRLRSTPRSRPR